MLKGNKGEWSETYTLLKLLAEGKLYAADSDLNQLNTFYPIIKILRQESDCTTREYLYNKRIKVIDGKNGEVLKTIPVRTFVEQSKILLKKIREGTGSFRIPEIEEFLTSIDVKSLKAKSQDKSDIHMIVHDTITGLTPQLGFSIKSQLGNASTLLNSNKDATNFIYRIEGPIKNKNITDINSINTRSKIRDRIQEIYKLGCSISYFDLANDIFKTNLQLIDSSLPLIIGEVILEYFSGNGTSLEELVKIVADRNPCNFNLNYEHNFYEYKIKNFLTDAALGMTPSSVWNGRYDATGGYIIVRNDGELVCYHIYNRNEFQDYLLKNTKLEAPSSNRHQYGLLYKDGDHTYIKLNLQIRFKS